MFSQFKHLNRNTMIFFSLYIDVCAWMPVTTMDGNNKVKGWPLEFQLGRLGEWLPCAGVFAYTCWFLCVLSSCLLRIIQKLRCYRHCSLIRSYSYWLHYESETVLLIILIIKIWKWNTCHNHLVAHIPNTKEQNAPFHSQKRICKLGILCSQKTAEVGKTGRKKTELGLICCLWACRAIDKTMMETWRNTVEICI